MNEDMQKIPQESEKSQLTELFLTQLLENQHRIYTSIVIKVPNAVDADDVMQEVMMTMWRKFPEFQPGTNFLAWANRIAHFCILSFRKKQKTDKLQFGDQVLEIIQDKVIPQLDDIDARVQALEDCIGKMSDKDRRLVQMRYVEGLKTKDVAQKLNRPIQGLYKVMARIQNALLDCVSYKLSLSEREIT